MVELDYSLGYYLRFDLELDRDWCSARPGGGQVGAMSRK